jgi:hypothetical protein
MLKIFKKIFFFKEIFRSEGKWSVFWNKFGNILFVKMEFSKRNNYSARDPTYLVIQLSYICTTSQVTYLISENVNWAEPKIVPFEACKGCCWGTLGEYICKKWHTIWPKSCWYAATSVVAQYLVVPISTHFHKLRKQVCFISVMFSGLHKAQ